MKRHVLLLLAAALWCCTTALMAQKTKQDFQPADLQGIWQMYFYVSESPNIPGELRPGNTFKILSADGHITNFTLSQGKGAIITGEGTYEQVAADQYAEHIQRSIHFPVLNGRTNILTFELKENRLLQLKYFIEKDEEGNQIDTWYHETWVRCVMPTQYPKDLIR